MSTTWRPVGSWWRLRSRPVARPTPVGTWTRSAEHPDVGRVQVLRVELERRIAEELARTGQIPVVDVREPRDTRDVRDPGSTGGLRILKVFRRPQACGRG